MFLMQSYKVIRWGLRDSLPPLYPLICQINHVNMLFLVLLLNAIELMVHPSRVP